MIEWILTALAIVFLALLVVQYTVDLSAAWSRRITVAQFAIWAIFVIDFFVRLTLAQSKVDFLRHNWFSALTLLLPALRAFRAVQIVAILRSTQAVEFVPVANRGMRAMRATIARLAPIYIGALTIAILVLSAVGMLVIERSAAHPNIRTFSDALWWSAATITTVGSELYPVTDEGRALAVLVMVYGLAFAGYIAATLVTLLIGRQDGGDQLAALRDEIAALRRTISSEQRRQGVPMESGRATGNEALPETETSAVLSSRPERTIAPEHDQ